MKKRRTKSQPHRHEGRGGRRRSDSSVAPATIPDEQWDLPAGFLPDGSRLASLREVVDSSTPTANLSDLQLDKRIELVSSRLAAQPRFEIDIVGIGTVDKERAMAEVKAQTAVGRLLMEIEQRVIDDLVEAAAIVEESES